MRATTANIDSKPPNSRYSPSVPVSVYRELVAELQSVQSRLDVVTNHSYKLSQENQQLRQEINKLIQSCLQLQKLVDSSAPNTPNTPSSATVSQNQRHVENTPNNQPLSKSNMQSKNTPKSQTKVRKNTQNQASNKKTIKTSIPPRQPTPKPPKKVRREVVSVPVMNMDFPESEPMYIEEREIHYYLPLESKSRGFNGWWLFLTIVLIMISGFSAGYLVVRPFLQNQGQSITQ